MITTYVGPPELKSAFQTVERWLAENGIDEAVPERPTIRVKDGTLTYSAFGFEGDYRGHDFARIRVNDDRTDVALENRTVPLINPLTNEVRAAFRALEQVDDPISAVLVEA